MRWLLALLLLLVGCDRFDGEGVLVAPPCAEQSVEKLVPAKESSDAWIGGLVWVDLACPAPGATMSLSGPSGAVAGSTFVAHGGRQIRFEPATWLDPESNYLARLDTTDGYRDAWFVGLTPELAVAVWVGKDRGTLGLSGSQAALPVWARFVAASGTAGAFAEPQGLVEVSLCAESHGVAREACPATHIDLFVPGGEPETKCDLHGAPLPKVGRLFGGLFKRGGGER